MATFDDRIRLMARGRFKPSRAVFPHLDEDVEVGVRLLRDSEIDDCKADAVQWVREKAKRLGIDTVELLQIEASLIDRETTRRMIYRAFLDVDTIDADEPSRFFHLPGQVELLDPLTIDTLLEVYLDHQHAMNPFHGLDDQACNALIDELGKAFSGPTGPLLLARHDAATLRRLVRILVGRLQS